MGIVKTCNLDVTYVSSPRWTLNQISTACRRTCCTGDCRGRFISWCSVVVSTVIVYADTWTHVVACRCGTHAINSSCALACFGAAQQLPVSRDVYSISLHSRLRIQARFLESWRMASLSWVELTVDLDGLGYLCVFLHAQCHSIHSKTCLRSSRVHLRLLWACYLFSVCQLSFYDEHSWQNWNIVLVDTPSSANFLTPEERTYILWRKSTWPNPWAELMPISAISEYDNSLVGEEESWDIRHVWAAIIDWQVCTNSAKD